MLTYALHATTMNRDRAARSADDAVDFDAFDGGAPGGD
jgi:glycerol-3-phosphate dehydrogenase